MNQAEFLQYAIEQLERLNIPYMIVGSFASGAYGEPRLTQDIDIVVALPLEQVADLCAAFPSEQFYVSAEAARAAVLARGQFKVIHPDSGDKIDFMIARNDAWGTSQLAGRQLVSLLPRKSAYAARPEDIVLSKMLYYEEGGPEKHLRDIAGILKVSGDKVDREYVARWAQAFKIEPIWNAILARVGN